MATLTQKFLTMADVYKRTDGHGNVATIMEMMNTTAQEIFTDFTMMECNDGTKHIYTTRTGLADVSWGALYEGIPQGKSTTQQVTETTGFVNKLITIDKRVLELAGANAMAIRAQESEADIEAMAQELVTSMFYHNTATNVRLPKGLGARFGNLATSGAGNQIISAGGVGSDNTSIWFVTWGGSGLNMLYPKGTSAGIKQEDKGEQRVLDGVGNPYYVMEEMITAHAGFGLGDYRRVSRVANIDVSNMLGGSVQLYDFLRKAYYRVHGLRNQNVSVSNDTMPGRTVIYCNRDVMEALDGLAFNRGSADSYTRLRPMEIEGKEVLTYRGIPIRETSAILNTEAVVL
ncbi:MAG: major capsid protein [Paracoccaceae bacterium]